MITSVSLGFDEVTLSFGRFIFDSVTQIKPNEYC